MIFDCDSTLSSIEGIDRLAYRCRAEVEQLTEAAMRGEVALEEVYGRRLAIVQPTRDEVDALGEQYIATMVPGAREVVNGLQASGVTVYIVSGGIRNAVLTLARSLDVADDKVFAVDLHFSDDGSYAGFDTASPLARSGGKRVLLESWGSALTRPVMFVGDGATDLEAKPVVDCFVAFAGVIERPNVVAGADVVVRTPALTPLLPLALGERSLELTG
ncbi:MAG: HAD-IB family phosphatase [Gemmatimonadota bacterium]|nr:HAD-IB family phosphatase [Gemmatimonadota bacterium]